MSLNSLRTIELSMSHGNMCDKIAELLYTLGYVRDNEQVVNIEFTNLNAELVQLKVEIKKESEVLFEHRHG